MKQEYADLVHRCFRCGWCKLPTNYEDFNCPAYLKYRFESFAAGGRMWLIRAWLNGEIETSERLAQILFSCVTCKNCVEACALPKIKDHLVDIFIDARAELVEQGFIPPQVRDYFKAVHISGNAYKRSQKERIKWADGLDIQSYADQEYLLYVGDVGSFDEIGMQMTRSVAVSLKELGVSFGILGEDEITDGNDVRALGEYGLFEYLARQNIETFKKLGVRKIITVSPHGFNTIRNEYPSHGGNFEVFHYSQIMAMFINKISFNGYNARVTYHDPCYLGRWNNEYFSSRMVLGAIPDLELVEMNRNMQNALCCGGGGGNFFTDILGSGNDSSSRVRIREAIQAGADIIAVACPLCYKMLDDARKAENLDNKVRIMDISEIVNASRSLV